MDWWDNALCELTDSLRLKCFDAVCLYVRNGEEPKDAEIKAITGLMRSAIDRDNEKWIAKIEKRRDAANKRWHPDKSDPNASKGNAKDANASFAAVSNAKDSVNVNVNVNGNVNVSSKEDIDTNVAEGTLSDSPFSKLNRRIKKELPYVAKMDKQMTEKELNALSSVYTKPKIFDTLCDMNNYKKDGKTIDKHYTSVYRTLVNWLKRKEATNEQ